MCQRMSTEDTFKFYQNDDHKHKAYRTRNRLWHNCMKVLETSPQSPDINPIKNLELRR